MADTRMQSWQHADMQDDRIVIACYADLGIGPAVVFDAGGFMNPDALRAYAADLVKAAEWLESEAHRGD